MKGELRISLPTNSRGDTWFEIHVTDDTSRIRHVDIKVSPGNLALALACRGVECTYELHGLDRVGLVYEWKSEVVAVAPTPGYQRKAMEAAARVAIEPFEVDGWTGRDEDALNDHNQVEKTSNSYRVHFDRWIPKP